MKIKYKLYLVHENMENNKIIGIMEGRDVYDYISKHDTVINDDLGTIEILGDAQYLKPCIVLDDDYTEASWDADPLITKEEHFVFRSDYDD